MFLNLFLLSPFNSISYQQPIIIKEMMEKQSGIELNVSFLNSKEINSEHIERQQEVHYEPVMISEQPQERIDNHEQVHKEIVLCGQALSEKQKDQYNITDLENSNKAIAQQQKQIRESIGIINQFITTGIITLIAIFTLILQISPKEVYKSVPFYFALTLGILEIYVIATIAINWWENRKRKKAVQEYFIQNEKIHAYLNIESLKVFKEKMEKKRQQPDPMPHKVIHSQGSPSERKESFSKKSIPA